MNYKSPDEQMCPDRSTLELLKELNIKYPILGAPMAGLSGGDLAATITLAGGLGFIATGYNDASFLIEQLEIAVLKLERARVYNPSIEDTLNIGIGFITWTIKEEVFELALNANPKAIWFSFGDYKPYLLRIRHRNKNIKVIVQVDNTKEAIQCARDGVDIVIGQGLEAGGHGPKNGTSTFCLVPSILKAFETIPNSPLVVAAGGISDWRGLSAALALGATGVVLGTALTVANESLLSDQAKQVILNAEEGGQSTVTTGKIDILRGINWDLNRYTARVLKNKLTDPSNQIQQFTKEDYEKAKKENNYDYLGVFAGMGVGLVSERSSANQIIDKIVKDYYYLHLQHRTRRQWIPVPSTISSKL